MEDIKELKNKMDNLEYKRITPLEKEVNDIKVTLAENNLLTEQNIKTNEKTISAMEDISKSMNKLFVMAEKNIETAQENTEAIKKNNKLYHKIHNEKRRRQPRIQRKDIQFKKDWNRLHKQKHTQKA